MNYRTKMIEDTKKNITIIGTNNRYKIKKLVSNNISNKKRIISTKWNLQEEFYQKNIQLEHLKDIASVMERTKVHDLIVSQIECKLSNYKQQDILKKKYLDTQIIKFDETITKLINSELKCIYCLKDIYILYKIVREMSQWTLDRIDNDKGHFTDNVVISCLECNLKRKKQNSENFLFTKQMKIIRSN
jgi:hypothetical protein